MRGTQEEERKKEKVHSANVVVVWGVTSTGYQKVLARSIKFSTARIKDGGPGREEGEK